LLIDRQAQYSAIAYPSGTVVDDLLLYRRAADSFLLVVNAGNIQKDFDWIQSHNHFNATLKNISDQVTLLAVQGPNSARILQSLTGIRLSEIGYYHFAEGKFLDADAIVSRTGYTGEDGFEIYFSPEYSESIWNSILEAGQPHG